jgi:hypothetical protein
MMTTLYTAAYCHEQAIEAEKIARFVSIIEQKVRFRAEAERWRRLALEADARERDGAIGSD